MNAGVFHDVIFFLPVPLENGVDRTAARAQRAADARFLVDAELQQLAANAGGTTFLHDVRQVFVAEIAQRGEHRVRRRLAQPAQAGVADNRRQRLEFFDVGQFGLAGANPVQNVEHLARADAAGRAFPARLVTAEFHEKPRNVHHARILVHHHHAARTHDRAELLQRLVVHALVEVLCGDDAAGRSAGLHGLEFLVLGNAAADAEDDFAQRGAVWHFGEARVADFAREREDLGAFRFSRCRTRHTISRPSK